MNYAGYEGCMLFDFDVVWGPITKFSGAIFILLGIFLTFFGGKFLRITFGIFVFLIVSVLLFSILYNLNLIKGLNQGKLFVFILVAIGCVLVGGVVAFFTQKFAHHWFVPIGAAVGMAALVAFVLAAFKTIPSWARIAGMIVGAFIGFWVSSYIQRYVKAGATALLGSILLFKGIGSFVGGFPSFAMAEMKSNTTNPIFYGYMVGMVVFWGLGYFIQLKYFNPHEDVTDPNDFTNKEFM